MFQDETGSGRINKPKYCWCRRGVRPSVPCHPVRAYRCAYGAVEPVTGESFFLVMPDCNTACMNVFLEKLSEEFPEDTILLCCDGASWHKSKDMVVPSNIVLLYIPPCTPEMNPIAQIWKEIRRRGVSNRLFSSLEQPTTTDTDQSIRSILHIFSSRHVGSGSFVMLFFIDLNFLNFFSISLLTFLCRIVCVTTTIYTIQGQISSFLCNFLFLLIHSKSTFFSSAFIPRHAGWIAKSRTFTCVPYVACSDIAVVGGM